MCGHAKIDHRQDEERACVYVECTCQRFSPRAGQKGLVHMALTFPTVHGFTQCRLIVSSPFRTHDLRAVDCPDCLHRESSGSSL